ncbi:MAG: tRNA pseudouridine(54/55) synthase Pus10 [Candidatus Bathyarchaeia archaeon]
MEILEKALRMLEKYCLCDHCLGRQFALLGYDMDNGERGHMIKTLLAMEGHRLAAAKDKKGISILKTLATNGFLDMATHLLKRFQRRIKAKEKCFLCEGRFEWLPELVNRAVELLKNYDYETFLVGVKLPLEVEEREDEFKAEFGVEYSESIRNEFSRAIGKMIVKIVKKIVDYMKPDLVVIINPFTEQIELQVNPLFIMGRYKKLVRGISQSKWICMKCRGEGCARCNWTGKMYPESVEEIISSPVLEETQGEDASFHAAGREDIDARMLGRGRPFIIEIKRPKKRFLNLLELEEGINKEADGKVKVSNLRLVNREMVRKLKEMEGSEKLYRVTVEFDREVSDGELENLERTFKDLIIHQQTPRRVLHRRADVTREKYIYETRVRRLSKNRAEIRIRCQGGLYIKELVTGDEGRTRPNISEVIKAKTSPLELDVLNVYMKSRRSIKK